MSYDFYVLPNTGHHYFFVPFSRELIEKHGGQRGNLARSCKKNDKAWSPVVMPDHKGHYGWMRFRFGTKGAANNFGVWLAVETNLGSIKRGTFFDSYDVVRADMPSNREDYAVSPYAFAKVDDIRNNTDDAYTVNLSITVDKEVITLDKPIKIIWQQPEPATIPVDLVVDFGNTRTVVLALEDNPGMVKYGLLSSVCRNIRFLPRGQEFPDLMTSPEALKFESLGETIADSWFLLQEPMFADWDLPSCDGVTTPFYTSKEYLDKSTRRVEKGGILKADKVIVHERYHCIERVPQMFVEISPALMGQDAKTQMHNVDLTRGMNISMSSPKRYLWDREQSGRTHGQLAWHLNLNSWSGTVNRAVLPSLRGQICRYMYDDGRDWNIEQPPFEDPELNNRPGCVPRNGSATYPRSTAMVWSALTILESAYRQITSYNWRKGTAPYMNRRLRDVYVTFPSGWIALERAYYQQAWKQAVDIFTLAHMDSRESVNRKPGPNEKECDILGRPGLHVDLDEAVASQLPFIYSEINRMSANLWIELYGRNPRPGSHLDARVRVMTVDIGGGTLDSSIVEYRNIAPGDAIALRYKVLFRDCNSFAGDSVTKAIIEKVLLPSMLEVRGVDIEEDDDGIVSAFISAVGTKALVHLADKSKWQRIVKLLFLPIVRQWLTDVAVCNGGIYEGEEGKYRSIEECGADEVAINDFNAYLHDAGIDIDSFVKPEDRLVYDPDAINDCIEEELKLGIEPLGKFISAYDVDVVTLSGKISEMPKVEELLQRMLPIRKQRIVRMKNYFAGAWYPMSTDQRISDAKTVTAVGAALYAAGKNHLLGALWNIEEDLPDYTAVDSVSRCNRNYWGLMRAKGDRTGFDGIILRPEQDSNENERFAAGDGNSHYGMPMMINTYIGRQKYHAEDTMPERQYKLTWVGDVHDAPTSPLAVIIRRKEKVYTADMSSYEMEEDDIELVSVEPTSPRDAKTFDASNVRLMLRTMSEDGFWMEECRFNVEL